MMTDIYLKMLGIASGRVVGNVTKRTKLPKRIN